MKERIALSVLLSLSAAGLAVAGTDDLPPGPIHDRYPGLTCDVPAHAYTYSFEPYAEWDAYYAKGGEIQNYFEKTADKYGIMPHVRFNSEVVSTVWDEGAGVWRLGLITGEEVEADLRTQR